ncbi:MAG TPA: CHAT domain-containing tetratricopeptide repeat protein, partial [Myxococcaceae bacterium]
MLWEKAFGKNTPRVTLSFNHLVLYAVEGPYAETGPLIQRALELRKAALERDHFVFARALSDLAAFYAKQGNSERAGSLYERALLIREMVLGKRHPNLVLSLGELARFYTGQGKHARAEPLYRRVLALQEESLGKHHPRVANSLNSLALNHLAQQHLSEAVQLFARAFAISEMHLRQEVFGFSEERLSSVLHQRRTVDEFLYSLVRAYPDDAGARNLALTAALLRKSRSVEEISASSIIVHKHLGPDDRAAFEHLRSMRSELASLLLSGSGSLPPTDYQRRIKELTDQGDALEEALARRSEQLRARYAPPVPAELIRRVATALPRDSALIEFVAYRDLALLSRPDASASRESNELRYLALLLFADGQTRVVDLGSAEALDRAIQQLHQALAHRAVSYESAAQSLYAQAFSPLVPLLGGIQRLFLSPDGQLALVPFAALHDGSQFLVDTWDITYVTSGKDLLSRGESSHPNRSVVVLADPAFSLPSSATPLRAPVSSEDMPWSPLPGTRREAETIVSLLPQAHVLLGSSATKDALLKLSAPGILHIATHGFFIEDGPLPPAGSRAVERGYTPGDLGSQQRPPDFERVPEGASSDVSAFSPDPLSLAPPLIRSGLVLAPDQTATSHPQIGVVTAL